MRIDVPGYGVLEVAHLVCDFNGTLALDGRLMDGVQQILNRLARQISVHVITADTHGSVREQLKDVDCEIVVIGQEDQARDKRDFARSLNSGTVVALGNGRNDEAMLQEAGLGICLVLEEGAFTRSLLAADVVCRSVVDALALLENPNRLIATLRNQ
jgi:soluble P-type ATPase